MHNINQCQLKDNASRIGTYTYESRKTSFVEDSKAARHWQDMPVADLIVGGGGRGVGGRGGAVLGKIVLNNRFVPNPLGLAHIIWEIMDPPPHALVFTWIFVTVTFLTDKCLWFIPEKITFHTSLHLFYYLQQRLLLTEKFSVSNLFSYAVFWLSKFRQWY